MATPLVYDAALNPSQIALCNVADSQSQSISLGKQAVSGLWMLQVNGVDKSFLGTSNGLQCDEKVTAGKTMSVVKESRGKHQINWT
jgi:hypothetical protein